MDLQLALPPSNDSNASYTFASPRQQNFSLPYPIIKYMFKNPNSGKAWKKLIQTCKYFFSKNPIYPVERLNYDRYSKKWNADEELFDSTKNIAKLWIYDNINVGIAASILLSSFIRKINKCNLYFLEIWDQHFTYDEYQFLTSSGYIMLVLLYRCTISHSDGTLVTFDQLCGNIPRLKIFNMSCAKNSPSIFKKDSFTKLAEILPCLKTFTYLNLYGLTEEFDFASITDFLLKNENIFICLDFDKNIPLSDAYKEILERFIAKIIETPPERIPHISFRGFENSVFYEDYRKLYDLKK